MYVTAVETALVRRSSSLLFMLEGPTLVGFDFLKKSASHIDALDHAILSWAVSWVPAGGIIAALAPIHGHARVAAALDRLIRLGFLVVSGTDDAARDLEYQTKWSWGPMAGYYHFGIKDPGYITLEQAASWLGFRGRTTPHVPLFTTNERYSNVVKLPAANLAAEPFRTMSRRRSYRGFDRGQKKIALSQLRDCLYCSVAITHFADVEYDTVPLKMTPSGGGRNPYEAYVYAAKVDGLSPGIYHYSAVENSLGLVKTPPLPAIGEILGGQAWFDDAAAVILLVANFERTMWKYPHPTGFRVVLVEAGHIGQNMLLAATAHDLACAPTGAINDTIAEKALGIDRDSGGSLTSAVLYAIAIGPRSETPSAGDIVKTVPNPRVM